MASTDSAKASGYAQSRKGRRSIRVHNLLKKAGLDKVSGWTEHPATAAALGGLVGGVAVPELVSAATQRTFNPSVSGKARVIGALLGSGILGTARYLTRRGQAGMEKLQAVGGQDHRAPSSTPGQFKPPTQDSTGFSRKQLQQSSAEVGPNPKFKVASMTSSFLDGDPLIQYLRKESQEKALELNALVPEPTDNLKLPAPSDKAGEEKLLEDNKENMPKGKPETEMTSECPCPREEMEAASDDTWKGYLQTQFENRITKKKYTGHDRPAEVGDDGSRTVSEAAESVVKKAFDI